MSEKGPKLPEGWSVIKGGRQEKGPVEQGQRERAFSVTELSGLHDRIVAFQPVDIDRQITDNKADMQNARRVVAGWPPETLVEFLEEGNPWDVNPFQTQAALDELLQLMKKGTDTQST